MMNIRFTTNNFGTSESTLRPLAKMQFALPEGATGDVHAQFEAMTVRPGATETLFQVAGMLSIAASVGGNVALGVVSNWIWSIVSQWRSHRQARPADNELRVEFTGSDGSHVLIDIHTRQTVESSVKVALKLDIN